MAVYVSTNVNEGYGRGYIKALLDKAFLFPGVSYTDAPDDGGVYGGMGAFHFRKMADTATNAPEAVGTAYTDEANSDSMVNVLLNNQYTESVKILNAALAATADDVLQAKLDQVAKKTQVRRGRSAIACLATEGTKTVQSATLTKDNIKTEILKMMAKCTGANGDAADCILVTPAVYALIVDAFGKEFTPTINEAASMTGRVNNWLGCNVIECTALADAGSVAYTYINNAGTSTSVSAANVKKINFIAYNHKDLAIMDLLNEARGVQSELFPGVKVQGNLVSGFATVYGANVQVNVSAAFA